MAIGGMIANALSRLRQVLGVVRFQPFDTSTETGRSHERYRRAALTSLASVMARALGLAATLITVPLTLQYLGTERYGMWMTISSVIAMTSFADLGIGNGLVSALADASARRDHPAARRFVSSAACILGVLSACALLFFAIVWPYVPWPRLLKVSSELAVNEAGAAMAVFCVCNVGAIGLSFVANSRTAYQEGFVNSVWQIAGSASSIAGVLLAVRLQASLPWLIFGVMAPPLAATLLNGAVLFLRDHPESRPSIAGLDRGTVKHLFRLGSLFLVLQIAYAAAFSSNNFVIAQVLSSAEVTTYSVPSRLFSIPMMLVSLLSAPLWPAYSEALARGDHSWVRRTLLRSMITGTAFAAACALVMVPFGNDLLRLWVKGSVVAPKSLLLGLGIWCVLYAIGSSLSPILNALRVFRFQVIAALTMAALNLSMSIVLASTWGVAGVIWATVISFAACTLIPTLIYLPRVLSRSLAASTEAANPALDPPPDGPLIS